MKNVLRLILVTSLAAMAFSCSKIESEIKVKNPTPTAPAPPAPTSSGQTPNPAQTSPAPTSSPDIPPIVITTKKKALVPGELLPTQFGQNAVINKMESTDLKGTKQLSKKYTLKTDKKISLNFKGWENIGRSQCEVTEKPEVTAIVKIGEIETSAKYSDLLVTELKPDQELSLTITIDNSNNCEMLLFEFAVIVTAIVDAPVAPPAQAELISIEVKEFLSAGTFGACVDLACFTRELRTSTKKYQNPKNKMEEITEDRFVIWPVTLELVCQNRRSIQDNSGIVNSTCKLLVNPALTTPEIKIYRGEGKKANLLGIDITAPELLEKLCNKWPNINSDEKVEVFVNDDEKKEVPRLELNCSYDKNLKVTLASFIGVLN